MTGNAPDLFDLDDEDYAVVKADPVPADQEDLAEQAIAECPRAGILSGDDLLARAREAMAKAREGGGDRVIVHGV